MDLKNNEQSNESLQPASGMQPPVSSQPDDLQPAQGLSSSKPAAAIAPVDSQLPPTPGAPSRVSSSKKKLLLFIGVAAVLVLLLGFAVTMKKADEPAKLQSSAPATTTVQAANVTITKDGFVPATIKVKAGQNVTWTNADEGQHQITSDPYPKNDALPGLAGDPLNKGDSFTFTLEKAGTFTYHDEKNPTMIVGTVIVE